MSARNTSGAHREKYARIERERRFLVAEFPSEGRPVRVTEIVDRYFPGTTLRLRRMIARVGEDATEICKLTQKVRSESGGAEQGLITTTYLSESEYELLARLPGDDLRKTRFSIRRGVDVFAPPLDGLILARGGVRDGQGDDGVPPSVLRADRGHERPQAHRRVPGPRHARRDRLVARRLRGEAGGSRATTRLLTPNRGLIPALLTPM